MNEFVFVYIVIKCTRDRKEKKKSMYERERGSITVYRIYLLYYIMKRKYSLLKTKKRERVGVNNRTKRVQV